MHKCLQQYSFTWKNEIKLVSPMNANKCLKIMVIKNMVVDGKLVIIYYVFKNT
jgi:hypothetical protein